MDIRNNDDCRLVCISIWPRIFTRSNGALQGIEIEEIVLHPFGGLARLRSEPENPRAEFRIAVAGPTASFLFAILAFGGSKVAALGEYHATIVVFFFCLGYPVTRSVQFTPWLSA